MTKQEVYNIFVSKGIIGQKRNKKHCWRRYFDTEAQQIFKEFASNYRTDDEAWFCLLKDVEPYTCEVCGAPAKFTGSTKSKILGYNTTCENCSPNQSHIKLSKFNVTICKRTTEERQNIVQKRKLTNKTKYGDENYMLFGSKSFKKNLNDKYGDKHYSNKEKARQTCLDRYGVDHNFKLFGSEHTKMVWENKHDEIISKTKETCLAKYGVESTNQIKEKQNKISATKQNNVINIENAYNCTQQRKLFKKYGQGWKVLGLEKFVISGRTFISNDDIPLIEQYVNEGTHTNKYVSDKECKLYEFIKTIYDGEILRNVTNRVKSTCSRYFELDIFLPELNIAFDFNGTYWHSNIYKDTYYHHRKTKCCYEQGVQIVHIYEFDWNTNVDTIKKNIQKLLNDKMSCIDIGWIPLELYSSYELSKPTEIKFDNFSIYTQGEFIKLNDI